VAAHLHPAVATRQGYILIIASATWLPIQIL
jgi:hypothetical protein